MASENLKLVGRVPLRIPRAERTIELTLAGLRTVSFRQDPLMSMEESFIVSLWDSAKKRDGAVIESAIMDAVDQTPGLRLLPIDLGKRRVDVQFEIVAGGHLVALEIKRGVLHDSKAKRQFRSDLVEIPKMLVRDRSIDSVHFHIVFIDGKPPLREGFTMVDLRKTYGLDVGLHVDAARRMFSRGVRAVMEERK
jgi:hypothetical protein